MWGGRQAGADHASRFDVGRGESRWVKEADNDGGGGFQERQSSVHVRWLSTAESIHNHAYKHFINTFT